MTQLSVRWVEGASYCRLGNPFRPLLASLQLLPYRLYTARERWMPTCRHFSLSLIASLLAVTADAETPPLGGSVFNLERNERIHYSCRSVSETDLECDFTRATVSQVLPAGKIAERLAEQLVQLDTPGAIEEFGEGSCEAIERLDAALANGEAEDLQYMPEADREALLDAFRQICEKQDRASIEAFFEFENDLEARTCMVSTLGWKGRFSKNDDRTWVRTDNDGPVGDGCGGIYLDRFELSELGSFWNLVRLEVASNPKGTFAATGQQCSEVYSGEEVEYRWQGGDLPARCDYIRLNLYD